MQNKLQVEYVSIDEIKTYENNAKLHPAEQIEQIKESIKEFGFNDPIAIDKDNVIIEGHGRYIACKELGITEVPIIRLNELSDEQKRAYMLVHNKLTMNTDFDIELLNDELENIFDIDMSKFDFEIEDIDLDSLDTDFELPDGDKGNIEQITFTLSNEQATLIRSALDMIDITQVKTFGNSNGNGNKIYGIVSEWVEQKT